MTNNTYAAPDLILNISGTFGIAMARNQLRQLVDKNQLPLMLRARSAAALTVLSEMVLFKSQEENACLELAVRILNEEVETLGLEFSFHAPLTSDIGKRFVVSEWQLERACDEIGIHNKGKYDHIIMRFWSRRRK